MWHPPPVSRPGRLAFVLALGLFAVVGVAAAAGAASRSAPLTKALVWPPPKEAFAPGNVVCAKPPSDGMRTILGIVVDHGAVDRAVGVLGASPLSEEGDAGDYSASRCWEAANGDGTLLCLERGEVHGGLTVVGREVASTRRGSS